MSVQADVRMLRCVNESRPTSAASKADKHKMERATGKRGGCPITVAPGFHPEAMASGIETKRDALCASPKSDESGERGCGPSAIRERGLPSLGYVTPSTLQLVRDERNEMYESSRALRTPKRASRCPTIKV